MNWLNSVVRKRSQKKTLGIVGNDAKSVVSSWRISPEQDESSHDKWWDIAKSHNRWVRIGVKCYPNNLSSEMSTATYIGLRLFKPDFQSGQWQRQGHFSFTVEELTAFVALLGLGDKAALESSGVKSATTQEFNRAMEEALTGGFREPTSISTFGKKPTGKKGFSKVNGAKVGSTTTTSKKRVQNVTGDCLTNGDNENITIEADVENQKLFEKRDFVMFNGETGTNIATTEDDDDEVFMN